MAGVEGREQLLKGVLDTTKSYKAAMVRQVETDVLEVAQKGAESVRFSILTEPSAFVNKNNRVYSGEMLNAVSFDSKKSGNQFTGRSGWVERKRQYFLIQEHGGMGTGDFSGRWVSPMNALMRAHRVMKDEAAKKGYEF